MTHDEMAAAEWQIAAKIAYGHARRFADNGWFISAKSFQQYAANYAKQARILMGIEE